MASVKAKFVSDPDSLLVAESEMKSFVSEGFAKFRANHQSKFTVEDVLRREGNVVPSFTNIEKWFTPEAFLGVSLVVEFGRTLPEPLKDAVLVALSAKMRSIGNVDVDVVRAEYSSKPRVNVDVSKLVSAQLRKMASGIAAMKRTHPDLGGAELIHLIEGSALAVDIEDNSIDFVITSPPYGVEALSYLRTHLLSYRSLASELDHDPYQTRDQTIGSEYLDAALVPEDPKVARASETFTEFFGGSEGGLDKKTLKRRAGMVQFFEDMHTMGERMSLWLKDRGRVAFVIGNKKLGQKVVPTDKIIIESFSASGLHLYDRLDHKLKTNNSNSQVPWQERIIQEEAILLFERRSHG
jgi:hypothetical protein